MYHIKIGLAGAPPIMFGHGWARDHRDFIPVAESLTRMAQSHLVDFPGFGRSKRPEDAWGSAEYSDFAAAFIAAEIQEPVIWVGHSFGGRVGIQMAVRHPQWIRALVLVGSAGIRVRRSRYARWRARVRQAQFKYQRARARTSEDKAKLERRFGSPDYVASGELGLRDIFVNVVNEDQRDNLRQIVAPTRFIYGAKDTETPPALGGEMAALVPGSRFEIVPEFDHNTILSRGYHVLSRRIKELAAR